MGYRSLPLKQETLHALPARTLQIVQHALGNREESILDLGLLQIGPRAVLRVASDNRPQCAHQQDRARVEAWAVVRPRRQAEIVRVEARLVENQEARMEVGEVKVHKMVELRWRQAEKPVSLVGGRRVPNELRHTGVFGKLGPRDFQAEGVLQISLAQRQG